MVNMIILIVRIVNGLNPSMAVAIALAHISPRAIDAPPLSNVVIPILNMMRKMPCGLLLLHWLHLVQWSKLPLPSLNYTGCRGFTECVMQHFVIVD